MAIQKLSSTLAIWNQDQNFMGFEIGARMTVVDLDGNGTLLVHSPVKLTEDIRKELEVLGKVTYVVAPNKWHHLYIGDFRAAYPKAKFFCAPGLDKKRSDFAFDRVIEDTQSFPWNPAVEHLIVQGAPGFSEVVFFHPQSRTLILTDTALHICDSSSFKTKIMFKLIGAFGKFGLSNFEKWMFVKDRRAFTASMKRVAEWDFDRIIMAHGTVIEKNGKQIFVKSYLSEN